MTLALRALTGAALAALVAAPALAGITADQVWQAWQQTVAAGGGTLTAQARRQGDRLVLTAPTWQPDTAIDSHLTIDRLVLAEQPDGSVAVLLPPAFDLTVTPTPTAPQPFPVGFDVAAPDLTLVIRGLGPALEFDARAPSLSLTLDEATLPRQPDTLREAFAALAAADLELSWRQDLGSPQQRLDGALSLGTLHAEFRLDTPQDGKGNASLDVSGLSAHLRGLSPASAAPLRDGGSDPTFPQVMQMLADGMFLDAGLTHGPIALFADIDDPAKGPVLVDLAAASGHAGLRGDKTALAYDTSLTDTRLRLRPNDPTLPLDELSLALASYRTAFSLGIADLTRPQPWSVAYQIAGLSLSENLWSLADPKAIFPHDPLSLVLDLSGTLALAPEALQPGFTARPDAPPLTNLTARLNELRLEAVGARITGQGALDFDPADTTTFDGAPAPTGTLSFAASGLSALIDRAERLGLVPPEDITAARFALLFIAKAGPDPDTLTSTVEFRDKSLFLNGQELR